MTLTELRKNLYAVIDDLLSTGGSLEIQRRGRTIVIAPKSGSSKLERLEKHAGRKALIGNPDDIVHMDWEAEWHPRHT